jgi:hypothetical protein
MTRLERLHRSDRLLSSYHDLGNFGICFDQGLLHDLLVGQYGNMVLRAKLGIG